MKSQLIFPVRILVQFLILTMLIISCKRNHDEADAYGNFEADEVIVSAQSQGELLYLNIIEGGIVEKHHLIGRIDSTVAAIKREQLLAQNTVIFARLKTLRRN